MGEKTFHMAQAVTRAKLQQIFQYLREYNQLRNPVEREIDAQPWVLWYHDLPEHESIQLGRAEGEKTEGVDYLLRVRRPATTRAPEPPEAIRPWLKRGWASPSGKVEVEESRIETLPDGTQHEVRFSDDPERVRLLQEYVQLHEEWAERERPAWEAMRVFERLYALHAQMERDSERYELVLGDGLLTWQPQDGERIHHPILLFPVNLEFDPDVPEFIIRESDRPPELYTALFANVPEVQSAALARCHQDLEENGYHPLGGKETDDFLRRVVIQLSPHGVFSPTAETSRRWDVPHITRSAVLFLRKRSFGYAKAIEAILEDLETRAEFPDALMTIVGIERPRSAHEAAESTDDSPNGEDENVFFTLPANPEQLRIAKLLERNGAVLVQGPPGTGKTHTIANLIGHLLAQGKSVLVTSEKAKALKVLRDKVVEPLRPLCVSVLDDDRNAHLDAAIDAITDKLSSANVASLEREAAVLEQQRAKVLRQLREARAKLRDARFDEYRPVVVAGKEYSPTDAARKVAEGIGVNDWIPGPVKLGEPLPLSNTEVEELYRTNVSLTEEEEDELKAGLPDPACLPNPGEYEALFNEYQSLVGSTAHDRADLWKASTVPQTAASLQTLLHDIQSAVEVLSTNETWRLAAITAGSEGEGSCLTWRDLIAQIQAVSQLAKETELIIMRRGPQIDEEISLKEAERTLQAILAYLQQGGSLSRWSLLLNRDWKRLISHCEVGGSKPSAREDFEALLALVRVQAGRAELVQRWRRQMVALGAPDAEGPEPESICRQFIPDIERCLSWYQQTWEPLINRLKAEGFDWDVFLAEVPIDLSQFGGLRRLQVAATKYLPPIIHSRIKKLRLAEIEGALVSLRRTLESTLAQSNKHQGVVTDLLDAVRQGNPEAYARAFSRLAALWVKRKDLDRREQLLEKLERVAPSWAEAIRRRSGVHGGSQPPGNPSDAWLWRQLNDELDRRATVSLEELQRKINQLSQDLQRLTADLVERRAWANQIRRTTLQQRQALTGWKELMRRYGKGTGRRAPRLLAEARRLMPLCQSAVPVWIMPLNRVAETFDPAENHFDVVIIDEASQSDMLALVAIYLGKQVIVVGDHEQVSPLAVGIDSQRTQQLIDIYLTEIPNPRLYDGENSIYDLARTSYEPVCLLEHFRCVTPIIQFCNHLSYNGKIKPLRDASDLPRRPALVPYRVDGATEHGKINEKEAIVIASLLIAAAEQPEYENATFGVISLKGDQQARRIDQLLQRHMSTVEYQKRQVRCGNAADFQGDERDVIFLSMVDAPSGSGPLRLQTEGGNQMFKKRLNVAVSRARDQLWVVYSVNPSTDLKADDLRLRLLKHVMNPTAMDQQIENEISKAESEFERQVMTRLIRAGYRVVPQWPVGAYRIDMVVVDGDRKLAVECDGDRWHTLDNLQQDMTRQMILERMGWRFFRIRGSQFFRNPDAVMEELFKRLDELNIRPTANADSKSPMDVEVEELVERIKRRASEIRREWAESGEIMPFDDDSIDGAGSVLSLQTSNGDLTTGQDTQSSEREEARNELRENPASLEAIGIESTGEIRVVSPPARVCRIGCYVVVRTPDGEEFEFQLVPPGKGDPSRLLVASDSPLGRAVKDKVAGQRVKVFLPTGAEYYEILDVRDPED